MKITLDKQGLNVHEETGEERAWDGEKFAPTGQATFRAWSMDHSQIEPHMRGHGDDKTHHFAGMSKGDADAARDAAHEFKKQREA